MARPRLLARDLLGELVPPGQTEIVVGDSHFLHAAALPSWLTASAGTLTFVPPSNSSYGYAQVMSAATLDATARIQTTNQYPVGMYRAMLLEVSSFRLDAAGPLANISLHIDAPGAVGAYAIETTDVPQFRLLSGGESSIPPGGTEIAYSCRTSSQGIQRRNIGLLVSSQSKEAFFLENGQVIGWRDCTGLWTDGMVNPGIQVRTKEAVSHGFQVSRVKFTVWHN